MTHKVRTEVELLTDRAQPIGTVLVYHDIDADLEQIAYTAFRAVTAAKIDGTIISNADVDGWRA